MRRAKTLRGNALLAESVSEGSQPPTHHLPEFRVPAKSQVTMCSGGRTSKILLPQLGPCSESKRLCAPAQRQTQGNISAYAVSVLRRRRHCIHHDDKVGLQRATDEGEGLRGAVFAVMRRGTGSRGKISQKRAVQQ